MQSCEGEADIGVSVNLGARSYEIRVVSGQTAGFGPFVRAALEQDVVGQVMPLCTDRDRRPSG